MADNNSGESPQQESEQQPWYFRLGQKALCVVAGIVCAILGLIVCITFQAICVLAGVLQIMIGLLVLMLEAPCCCAYLDFIDKISKFSEGRAAWQKAVVYCLLPIIPVALCQSISSIIGNILVFLCGMTFAFSAMGKKASREEMLQNARGESGKSGLVDNAQPMAQSAPPAYSNIV